MRMRFDFVRNLIARHSRSCKIVLTVIWVLGFSCGISGAACADIPVSLMRACCESGVSIVGLFLVPFFPFLISAVAVYCSAPLILYLTGFCKSFLLGFFSCAVCSAFSGGGWLICLLLMFTDLFTAPAVLWFQLRQMNFCGKPDFRSGVFALLWFAAVSAVDYFCILPLLREII